MAERFISEPIRPQPGSFDTRGMARGEAGLPARFAWRGRSYTVGEVVQYWVTSDREGGSGELYLRRHWWQLRATDGALMTIYFERQARRGSWRGARSAPRWFLYSVAEAGTGAG